jgi:curved DNA-binding protein CbpA
MKNHYEILGVSRSAEAHEIKSAWRKLARRYHPDRNPDDERAKARFQEVAEAYQVLIDPEHRSGYDMLLAGMDLFSCACGNPKLPGSDLCRWCGLKRAREIEEAEREQRRQEKAARRAARRRRLQEDQLRAARAEAEDRARGRRAPASRKPPPGPRPAPGAAATPRTAAERSWEAAGKYIDGAREGASDPDTLLEGMLTHAALEASAGGLDLKVKLGPDGKVRLSGGTVDDMKRIKESVGVADRMLSGLRDFLGRGS